jgi:biopolymer transport protein ExbB/TolQ
LIFIPNFATLKKIMASIKNLKQDLNNAIGEIIEGSMLQQIVGDEKHKEKADELVEDSIAFFDEMITEINLKDVENRKKHLKEVTQKIDKKLEDLVERLNSL